MKNNQSNKSLPGNWPQLFTASPCWQNGSTGCLQQPSNPPCNTDSGSYCTTTGNSITITAGNDCRTMSTNGSFNFDLGDGNVTQISFDFDIVNYMNSGDQATWLAFWIYSEPWLNTVEVDFIESLNGPGTGLNTNFAGAPNTNQVVIFDNKQNWKGSIKATFSGSGDSVNVSVSNSANSNVGTATLTRSTSYFFVINTCQSPGVNNCAITISNLKVN